MKRIIKPLTLSLLIVTLSSCSLNVSTSSSSISSKPTTLSSTTSVDLISSSSSNSSSSKSYKNEIITVYAVNDVHGKIKNTSKYTGLVGLQGAIRSDARYDEESFVISSGDMWQGSYLSGKDKGLTTTSFMNDFGFKCMTLGNHEFDWGISQIKSNMESANFPLLCANLLDETGKKATWVDDYTIVDCGSNYKVGIVGLMDQLESSIKTDRLEGYTFSSNLTYVYKAVSDCKKAGADVVILSIHGDENATYVNRIQSLNDLDVIGIFGGHSHSYEFESSSSTVNIPYVQGGCDSNGYCSMTINKKTNSLVSIGYTELSPSYASTYATKADNELASKVNAYIQSTPDPIVGYVKGTWTREKTANLVLQAMFEACKIQYPNKNYTTSNLVAVHNTAGVRGELPSSSSTKEITMDDVQIVSPFDNTIILLQSNKVSTSQLSNNYCYPSSSSITNNSTYDVVVIDYLISNSRYCYGTFDTTNKVNLLDSEGNDYIIYDVVADYITRNSSSSNPINSSDY